MTRVALTGGYEKTRSILGGAARCLNLFPEKNPARSPYPFTYYLTPGLRKVAQADGREWRCLYLAGVGGFYGVCGPNVYHIDGAWNLTLLGTIGTHTGQCSMSDNRISVVLVDGSATGYVIDPFTRSFSTINPVNFYGADRVRYVDTFYVFNRPGTNQWYTSLSEVSVEMLTGGGVDGGSIVGGAGYANGSHAGVALSGGTGTGAVADVTVAAGVVTAVTLTQAGTGYRVGDVLTATAAALGGAVNTGTIAGGTGYVSAVYAGVALTGGSGSGAIASITVTAGVVTAVSVTAGGGSYVVGDVLSAPASALGGTGSGFTFTLTGTTSAGSGFAYTLTGIGSSAFDPLDIAAKTGASDDIVTIDIMYRYVWLFGARFETELWYNSGGADFAFSRLPGTYVEHGCASANSVAHTDVTMFWLGKDKEGNIIAFAGENNTAIRISTYAVETLWTDYEVTNDAIGFVYQQRGHTFYVLTFPSADKTWVYDLAEKEWHERAWSDEDGNEHRIRANCCAFAFSEIVVGDWETGALYLLDEGTYTDDGQPIQRRKGFPHLVSDGNRVAFQRLIAEMQSGSAPGLSTEESPEVSLRWSDTRGASWGNPVTQPIGSTGQYLTSIQWWRLGMGRDRVFELFWDFPYDTALTGAYIEAKPVGT